VSWLKSKGLNASFVSNDIVVDGYKVCGMCITRYGSIDYTAGFIGINTKLEDIKAICRKPMTKVPKGLSEYGIATEEIEQMFIDFCTGGIQ
jgi:lipoate-protein ligase A